MTEKRFEVMDYFDSENKPIKAIRDTETTEIYSMDNELEANSTCGLLNTLHEENEKLRKVEMLANHRGEMIGFANALIDDLGGETMKEMWDKFKNEKYEKWCELE